VGFLGSLDYKYEKFIGSSKEVKVLM
jgi:hypothetical protein